MIINATTLLGIIVLSVFSLFNTVYAAQKVVYVHTDNLQNFNSFKNGNIEQDISSITNGNALKVDGFTIQYEYMTVKRSFRFMDEGKDVCVINKIKTQDRLKKYTFSYPINIYLNRRLYQKLAATPLKDNLGNTLKTVSFPEVFNQRPNSKVLLTNQISYGELINQQLALIDQKNKMIRNGGEHDKGMFDMFFKGRAEFGLFFPQQVYNLSAMEQARSYELSAIKPYELGHLMCSGTALTQEFLTKVNQQINHIVRSGELLNHHLKFVLPSEHSAFKQHFQQVFKFLPKN